MRNFKASSQIYEKRPLTSSFPSVCLSAWDNWTELREIWYLCIFRKYVEKILVSLKSDKNNGCFFMDTFMYLWYYFAKVFLEWESFLTKVVEKIKTHNL